MDAEGGGVAVVLALAAEGPGRGEGLGALPSKKAVERQLQLQPCLLILAQLLLGGLPFLLLLLLLAGRLLLQLPAADEGLRGVLLGSVLLQAGQGAGTEAW